MFVSSSNLFDCGCHFLQFWNDASKFIWYDLDENQIWPINRFRETKIIEIALAKESVVIIYFRRYLFFSFSTLSSHERVCDVLPQPSVYR